jgi:MoaA/NifB/PqqE/SkfB family radical SAM enzyme
MRERPDNMSVASVDGAEIPVAPQDLRVDSADLYVNTRCNFVCKTCFLGDAYFERDLSMTPSDVESIARWLEPAGVRDIAVLGGEPTLHPDIVTIMRTLRDVGVRHTRLVTNGTPRARRLLETDFAELVDLVYVSLDGAHGEINDAIRGRGAFRHAMSTIDLLRRLGRPFVITATLGSAAAAPDEVGALLGLAEASGCRTLNVHWLSAVGRARGRGLTIPPREWDAVVSRIAAYTPKRDDLEVECQVGSFLQGTAWASGVDTRACAVRDRSNLEFLPDGTVFSCGLLVDAPGLAGYRWNGRQLLRRAGESELSVCTSFSGDGCPARQTVLGEPPDGEYLPVCIYQRIARSRTR